MADTLRQIFRFLSGGAVTTLASYAIYIGLLKFTSPEAAYTIAFILGLVLSYLINTLFVFRKTTGGASLARFLGVYACVYVIGLLALSLLRKPLGFSPYMAGLLTIAINAGASYVLLRRFTYGTDEE